MVMYNSTTTIVSEGCLMWRGEGISYIMHQTPIIMQIQSSASGLVKLLIPSIFTIKYGHLVQGGAP